MNHHDIQPPNPGEVVMLFLLLAGVAGVLVRC